MARSTITRTRRTGGLVQWLSNAAFILRHPFIYVQLYREVRRANGR